MRLGTILAGLAILWVAKPAFPDSSALETFREPGGVYYRFPPGYLWENGQYNFSILIPEGAEACSQNGVMDSHGRTMGPIDTPCRDVLDHPATRISASYNIAQSEPVGKQTLIRENCRVHRATAANIVVDGQAFLKCLGDSDYPGTASRYMDYFTFSEPIPATELHVYIVCPTTGNCNQWIRKWEKLIFNNLHIHWQRDDASEATDGTGKGHDK
jgi:hypothetical protein